jgi:hypothetical protein
VKVAQHFSAGFAFLEATHPARDDGVLLNPCSAARGYTQSFLSLRDGPILTLTPMRDHGIGQVHHGGCSSFTPVRLGPPCRRPILNRNDITGICKTAHLLFRMGK